MRMGVDTCWFAIHWQIKPSTGGDDLHVFVNARAVVLNTLLYSDCGHLCCCASANL